MMKNFSINLYILVPIEMNDIFITKKKQSSTLNKQADSKPDSQSQLSLEDSESQIKQKSDNEILRVLREKTVFKYAKAFPKQKILYLYDPDNCYYVLANQSHTISLLSKIFHHCLSSGSLSYYPTHNTLERLEKLLRVDFYGSLTSPHYDLDYLIMENGALNVKTFELVKATPNIFQITAVNYPWDPETTCYAFLTFLKEFCENKEDQMLFIRSYMWAALTGYYEDQSFLALFGPGGTGKSQLTNIFIAVIGAHNSITTSLRDLCHDKFEIPLLLDKRLVVISDHEYYKGDTSVLKQLIGGDSARGRVKNSMEIGDQRCFAKFIVVGNTPIASFDAGGAMNRRQVAIPAYNISESRVDLLGFDKNNNPTGLLKNEIPGIAFWALSMDPDQAKRYLTDRSLLDSLTQSCEDIELITNPIKSWIKDELEKGSGCYLGYLPNCNSIQSAFEVKRRHLLFPAYLLWCKKHNIQESTSYTVFKRTLLDNLKALGYSSSCSRRAPGMFVTGIQFKPTAFDVDSSYGGEVKLFDLDNYQTDLGAENPTNSRTDNPQEQPAAIVLDAPTPASTSVDPIPYKQPEFYSNREPNSKGQEVIDKYLKLLGRTDRKALLNQKTKVHLKENKSLFVDQLLQGHLRTIENPTKKYEKAYLKRCQNSLTSISSFGIIPYKYARSESHRCSPINSSISALKEAKKIAYSFMAEELDKKDYALLQFDMKSCYPSILAGMYPQQLPQLCSALNNDGLWRTIGNWFKQEGKEHLFSKKAVKACVHASYFQSGEQKLFNLFLENIALEKGMLLEELKVDINLKQYREAAGNGVETLKRNPIICELKNITNHISNEFDNQVIYGPSGYACNFNRGSKFISEFALYMQSYEIAIVAMTVLEVIKEYPEIEMLEHHHDGFLLIASQDNRLLVIESFKKNLEKVRKTLGLSISLKWEHNDFSNIECRSNLHFT